MASMWHAPIVQWLSDELILCFHVTDSQAEVYNWTICIDRLTYIKQSVTSSVCVAVMKLRTDTCFTFYVLLAKSC